MNAKGLLENDRLRIAINAQITPASGAGGVESVLAGLLKTLGRLDDGKEEYIIIGTRHNQDWLRSLLGPNQRIVLAPETSLRAKVGRVLDHAPRPIISMARSIHNLLCSATGHVSHLEVPVSNGFYESLSCDVIHFPYQNFVLCALPTIFNPHDLQHLHYPQFFSPSTIAWREVIYPAGCHFAHTIVVGSHWVKHDITKHYHIDPEKVQVIPWAAPTQAYCEPTTELLNAVKVKYGLRLPFALYPAMTWPHKNHLRLLQALCHLKDSCGIVVQLVGTGKQTAEHWPRIADCIQELHMEDQVHFLGLVPPEDLRAIYSLAQFVVVPTLFEAASGPVFEAWQEGTPVACSTVTSLPEQVGKAALLFDPVSVEDIGNAVKRMATDEQLRSRLVSEGQLRLQDFSWERTAQAYRAVYRRAAQYPLSNEDRYLLGWDWMRDSRAISEGFS